MTLFTKIWERYFIAQFAKMFCLFLGCFYGLYILIDYASHTGSLASHSLQIAWYEIARYYLYIFASRAEILLPLALLIAFVHTLCTLNTHHELVAFMAGGLSLKTLMRPFLTAAFLFVCLLYMNEQFLLPTALKKLRRIEDAAKHRKRRHVVDLAANHVILEDGSLLIYQDYDTSQERFFDTYWIESVNSIYRMKTLAASSLTPVGYHVDHLIREPNGELFQQSAHPELTLPGIKFNANLLQSALFDPDILPLITLHEETRSISNVPTEKESKLLTAYYWKLLMPWLCILAILAPAPFCVTFSRRLPLFGIYACSLFGLIALYMVMDAAQVVAKRQVLPPFLAICVPFAAAFAFFTRRYIKCVQ